MAQKTVRKASPASAAKKPKSAPSRRSTAVRVGGKKSSNKFVNFLTSGNKRWIALVAFVLVFGAIGAYYLQNSRAALSVSNYYCTSTPTLRLTSPYTKGSCVKKLQASLNAANGAGLSVDGVFGPASKTAVYNFQVKHGLLRDGIAGSQTWGKLDYFIDWFTPGTTSSAPTPTGSCPSGTTNYGAKEGWQNGVKYSISTCGLNDWPASFPNSAGQYTVEVNSTIAPSAAAMARELKAAASAGGWSHTASGGFRSYYQQKCIYDYYVTGVRGCSMFATRPSAAAKPGYSNHQMGYSIDLPTGYTCSSPTFKSSISANKWLNANMGRFGFSRDVGCGDYGHFTKKP